MKHALELSEKFEKIDNRTPRSRHTETDGGKDKKNSSGPMSSSSSK